MGAWANDLRKAGKPVVGGSPYSDKLEDDRAFGQNELKAAGVSIIPQENFTSFDDAIEYVHKNPNRYVIKPSGEAQNYKRLLFVGEEEDGRDVVEVLEDYKRAWSKKIKEFQLQRRIMGVEVATGGFFNGKEFVTPICVNFEHKKLFPGDIGPATGEMGTAMFWSEPNKIFNATLKRWSQARARSATSATSTSTASSTATASTRSSSRRASATPRSASSRRASSRRSGSSSSSWPRARSAACAARSGFQVGVRIVVPPFPFKDQADLREQLEGRGDPLQDAEPRGLPHRGRAPGERRVARDGHVRRRADRLRHRPHDDARPSARPTTASAT